ncbi:MAG: hypothetical protein M0Z52_07295 [Actinomycetota bacterium]|nr:hypothetical protein [Actinomycetota bacterium]
MKIKFPLIMVVAFFALCSLTYALTRPYVDSQGVMHFPNGADYNGPTSFDDIKTKGPWLDVRAFGVVDDPTDINNATNTTDFQAAIDNAIALQEPLICPTGTYHITQPLRGFQFAGGAFTPFTSFTLEGMKMPAESSSAIGNTCDIEADFSNAPALIVQGARSVMIKNVRIHGQNDFSGSWSDALLMGPASGYVINGARDSRYSPYTGIAIDPFYTSLPSDGGYPGLSQYYVASAVGSSHIEIDNVMVQGFVAGIGIQTGGYLGNGAEMVLNNDFLEYNKVGLAMTSTQSRNIFWYGGNIGYAWAGIDGLLYGAQQGELPHISGIGMGQAKYLLDVYDRGGSSNEINGLHAETFGSIGFLGTSASTSRDPFIINGGELTFYMPVSGAVPDFQLLTYSPFECDGCNISEAFGAGGAGGGVNTFPLRFATANQEDVAPITFKDSYFTAYENGFALAPLNGQSAQVTQGNNFFFENNTLGDGGSSGPSGGSAVFSDKMIMTSDTNLNKALVPYGATAMFQDGTGDLYHVDAKQNYALLNAAAPVTISGGTATFSVADANTVEAGDMVYVYNAVSAYEGPGGASFTDNVTCLGVVNGVSGNTVTAFGVPQDFPAGTYDLYAHHWGRWHAASTGTLTGNSTSITSVTNATAWAVGDHIAGAGIPAGAYITAISGTTFTISDPATTGGSAVRLYDANIFTYSPGGGSSTPTVTSYIANATVPDSALERGFVDNTGATSNITLTLPACTSTVDSGVFYVTVADTITIAPNGTDQVAVGGLNCTAGHSVTSDTNIGTFVGLSCLASGKWYLTGINGGWTCN